MLSDRCYQLRETAAAGSLERIRLDRARAPGHLRPVFTYIERHLFDRGFTVRRLKEAVGSRDRMFAARVRDACGRTPRRYIADRRFETACRLLEERELRLWQIAELLGFPELQAFSRAFAYWAGETPSRYRRRAPRAPAGGRAELAPGAERRFADPGFLGRAVAGELSTAEASALVERLLRLYRP